MTDPSESSPRIRSILLPPEVRLKSRGFHAPDLSPLLQIPSHLPLLGIQNLVIYLSPWFTSPMKRWSPLLRLVNPTGLNFHSATTSTKALHASTFVVPSQELAFAGRWNRLDSVTASGVKSIPILGGDEETFSFSECLLRGGGAEWTLSFQVVEQRLYGEDVLTEIQENAIATHLAQLSATDLMRSPRGAHRYVFVIET